MTQIPFELFVKFYYPICQISYASSILKRRQVETFKFHLLFLMFIWLELLQGQVRSRTWKTISALWTWNLQKKTWRRYQMLYQSKMWRVEEAIKTWIIFNGSSLTLLLKINYLHLPFYGYCPFHLDNAMFLWSEWLDLC